MVSTSSSNPQEVIISQLVGKVAIATVDYGPCVKPVSKVVEHGIKMAHQTENCVYVSTGVIATTGAGGVGQFIEKLAQGARKIGQMFPWF